MFDFAFQKFFEKHLTIFKFFSLLQINIFVMFLYYFKKNMLRLCLAATPVPRNFKIFNFFLYFKIIFSSCFGIIFKIFYRKTNFKIVSGWEARLKKLKIISFFALKLIFVWFFFSLLQINFFYVFIYFFKMLALCLTTMPNPRNFEFWISFFVSK